MVQRAVSSGDISIAKFYQGKTATIDFNANGSGTFAGSITAVGAIKAGNANDVSGNNLIVAGSSYFYTDTPSAAITLKRQSGTNESADYLQCRDKDNNPDVVISPGGSASFAGGDG